jgi:uncharacterized membrane protein YoaK (UPF0700 family)
MVGPVREQMVARELTTPTPAGGMLAVSGMAVRNALVRVSLAGVPSTAVMTTDISVFTMDLGEIWFGRNQSSRTVSRARMQRTWPAIAGFLFCCIVGALCEQAFGLTSFAVPTLLSLGAIGFSWRDPRPAKNPARP